MKKSAIFIFLALSVVLFDSCRKKDNPLLPDGLTRFPTPLLTKDASSSAQIVVSNLGSFNGKIIVDKYFKSDLPPKKYDLVVIKNGVTTKVKTLKGDITAFPTTVSFTAAELATLFGEPIQTCDFFDFGVNVTTQDGQTFEAYPAIGNSYASGIAAQPGSSTTVRYNTKVEFNPADFTGNFTVVSDEFADFTPGSTVVLTAVSANQFSFISPQAANPLPIIVTVDPNTLLATITKQKIGDYFKWHPPYTNPNVAAGGANSNVAPCTKTVSLSLSYSVDQGSFPGTYLLVLRKP